MQHQVRILAEGPNVGLLSSQISLIAPFNLHLPGDRRLEGRKLRPYLRQTSQVQGRVAQQIEGAAPDAVLIDGDTCQGKGVRSGGQRFRQGLAGGERSEEHTSELQSLMRSSYAVFCLKNKKK